MAARGRSLFSLYMHCKFFKNLLVKKYWPDLKIILHKCSLGHPLQRLFKYFRSVEKPGRQGAELVFSSPSVVVVLPFTFSYKRLLLLHQLTKFKIILQECSLGGSPSNLFKEFYSMQNFGCHGNIKGEINQNLKNLLV